MTGAIEKLDWDSNFFGFSIGRATLDGATPALLADIETEARDLGVECIYGMLDPADGDATYLLQQVGYRLVEVQVTFNRPDIPFSPKPTVSKVRRGTPDDLPLLEPTIDKLAPWSRFAVDPRFGSDAALRMFRAWVQRAAHDGEEYMLLVAEDDSGVTGLSTHVRSPVPRMDLLGVITQGSGAAVALMQGYIEWAGAGQIEAGPCAARNIAILRFLERCGFAIFRTHYTFHRWFDEAVPEIPPSPAPR